MEKLIIGEVYTVQHNKYGLFDILVSESDKIAANIYSITGMITNGACTIGANEVNNIYIPYDTVEIFVSEKSITLKPH